MTVRQGSLCIHKGCQLLVLGEKLFIYYFIHLWELCLGIKRKIIMHDVHLTIYNTALGKRAGEKVISRDNLLFREGSRLF